MSQMWNILLWRLWKVNKERRRKMIDERTEKYFEDLKNNMGYRGNNAGWDGIKEILEKKGVIDTAKLQKINVYNGFMNSSDIDIYGYEVDSEKRFCAELSYQTNVDDYCTETHIFINIPSQEDVHTAIDINNLLFKFDHGGLKPEFNCWECGRFVHWLDRDGDFKTKKFGLEEKYCGC